MSKREDMLNKLKAARKEIFDVYIDGLKCLDRELARKIKSTHYQLDEIIAAIIIDYTEDLEEYGKRNDG